jgi:hypothetical protein
LALSERHLVKAGGYILAKGTDALVQIGVGGAVVLLERGR